MGVMRERQAEGIVGVFNEYYPSGTNVVLINDLGEREMTATRSEAFTDANFIPVVMVVGRSGYYLLDRIVPIVSRETKVEGGE